MCWRLSAEDGLNVQYSINVSEISGTTINYLHDLLNRAIWDHDLTQQNVAFIRLMYRKQQ